MKRKVSHPRRRSRPAASAATAEQRPLRVLLGVGGGIAAYKAATLASLLVQQGCSVRVAMTPRATEFVGALTFAGLCGSQVILSSTQIDSDGSPPHIAAAQQAEVYVIAPATADLLARLAAGACDDAVALLAVTCRCPVLLCPAMNDAMWLHAATQRNVGTLRKRGMQILGPVVGRLAEGYAAIGRLVEPEVIAAAVLALGHKA
jgi:phosphopantothenoylcysteine decarboxylase / phosphopantothenate---cysteine ligase